jgi:CRP-like cAMP-binding protein
VLKRRSEHIEALKAVPLFAGLARRQLEAVSRLSSQVEVRAGTVLMRQGQRGRDFVLILEGTGRIERNGEKVGNVGPGAFFGEISLLDGQPRTATVITESACSLLVVDSRSFGELLDTVPGLQRQVVLALCARLREAYADLSQ